MRIMLLIPTLNIGGAERYVVTLANLLSNDGHLVFIVTMNEEGTMKESLNSEVKCIALGNDLKVNFSKVKRLTNILRENQIDICHSHLFKADLLNFLTFTKKGLKISTEHSSTSRRKKFILFGLMQNLIYLRFAKVIAISESVKKHLIEWAKVDNKKLKVIYNGTKFSLMKPFELRSKFTNFKNKTHFGTIARLDKRKDLKIALNAMKHLINHHQYNNFHYSIYGDGPELENLVLESKILDLEDYVTFVGFEPNIQEVIDDIDIHILPSIEEGFGLTVIETMARGIPNVLSNSGSFPEIIDDNYNGLLFEVGNFKDLADKISYLIKDDEKRRLFSTRSVQRVKDNFLVEVNKNKVTLLYESELKNRGIFYE